MMTCRQNGGLTEWNGGSPKPLMYLVGAAGFELATPCSQKRGKPSKFKARSVSSRAVRGMAHQWLSGDDRIEVAGFAGHAWARPLIAAALSRDCRTSTNPETNRPDIPRGSGPDSQFVMSPVACVNRLVATEQSATRNGITFRPDTAKLQVTAMLMFLFREEIGDGRQPTPQG